MSANAFGSDWAQLEAGTFRFRDPLNKERRSPTMNRWAILDRPWRDCVAHRTVSWSRESEL